MFSNKWVCFKNVVCKQEIERRIFKKVITTCSCLAGQLEKNPLVIKMLPSCTAQKKYFFNKQSYNSIGLPFSSDSMHKSVDI